MIKEQVKENTYKQEKKVYDGLKRVFDILCCIVAIPFLCIPVAVISLLIVRNDHGSVLYVSRRIGKNGKAFDFYKFRTMKMNADSLEKMLTPEEYARYKKEYKLDRDPRITKVGNFLRKTSLDELPQLINVLKGDMCLVGPRPLLEEETYIYGADRDKLLSIKPGLTGYWQAYARNNAGYENGQRQKMEMYYIDNRSVLLDIKILFATVGRVLKREGAK